MSTRTSDRYPETLANRSASSKASREAFVWRRWATVARRGRTISTRGGLSAFVEFTGDGDAARCRTASMPPAPMATTITKTLMLVLFVTFMLFRLQNSFWLFRRPSMEFGASVATIRHRPEPRLRFEIPAIRVVRIERRGYRGMPRLQRGQDRRQDDERGARCTEQAAEHRPPKRRPLLSAFA